MGGSGGGGGGGAGTGGGGGGGAPAGYVRITAGTFTMGSPTSECSSTRGSDETRHQQTITHDYYMKVNEVTQGEWMALMNNNPSAFAACGASCPVEMVSWWDAVTYANALSQQEGHAQCYTLSGCTGMPGTSGYTCTGVTFAGISCTGYRLPTEAEWEYAARAGDTRAFYTGDITTCTRDCGDDPALDIAAWYCQNSTSTTHAARGKSPNAWGLYDMLGNVWEWCWDWYDLYPTANRPDYLGAATGSIRVLRGGRWYSSAVDARAARRDVNFPGDRFNSIGFRLCRSVVP
jgi:formylglycine-generating enzyme required for sulfatase activity